MGDTGPSFQPIQASGSPAWWVNHFDDWYVDVWEPFLDQQRTEDEASCIEYLLQLHGATGRRLLDVPCGTGRLTRELAQRGFQVHGVDLSREMIRAAHRHPLHRGASYSVANMHELPWVDAFDAAYMWHLSLGYTTDTADDVTAVTSIARTLHPGGLFLLDMDHLGFLRKHFEAEYEYAHDSGRVRGVRSLDDDNVYRETQVLTGPAGGSVSRNVTIRTYSIEQMQDLCERAGLRVLGCTDESGRAEPTDDSRLLIVAQVPA